MSIGTKIILPYFLLTLIVASVGTFIVTNLVASSLQERINNQLLDAGRIVSEGMVRHEEQRLQTLRAVVGTTGIPLAVANEDADALAALAPQLVINSNSDAVELLNMDGIEIYGWQHIPETAPDSSFERSGSDFSSINAVQLALNNVEDEFGNKHVFLTETDNGLMLFTASPVFLRGQQVGVAMVGTFVRQMLLELTLNAVARVTLYDQGGQVLDTTLGGGEVGINALYQNDPAQYTAVLDTLVEPPSRYDTVVNNPNQVPLRQIDILNQQYILAYGDWRLRGQSFGMFSVALPSNFIVNTIATSRAQFTAFFTLAIVAVFLGGFVIARRITKPINHLVSTAQAVTAGDLEQRSNIAGQDEIGQLSRSFDLMTETLSNRNKELENKSGQLEAIVQSIADGVIVLDNDDNIISLNPAAQRLLADMSHDFFSGPLRELTASLDQDTAKPEEREAHALAGAMPTPNRYQVGNRVLSALAAPVLSDSKEKIGNVIVLRDITQEVEAENLKSAFITSISHELRTPLTVIKVYADLMRTRTNGHMDEQQKLFLRNINKGSQQLEHHINQLINISEIQAGTISMEKERQILTKLLQPITEKWRERFQEKDITLEFSVPAEEIWLDVDGENLGWAVENLLSNALNYTEEGGHVELCLQRQGDQVRIDVLDNGIGIAAADQKHLFDRFFRASNNVNFEARGVGLGLFIARSIVEMHGGEIVVSSELGEGSAFSILLPAGG